MSFKIEVDRGVALLDKHNPGWREKIDREKLDLNDFWNCILGQLYGVMDDGMNELFGEGQWRDNDAVAHGFWLNTAKRYDYPGLTSEWKSRLS